MKRTLILFTLLWSTLHGWGQAYQSGIREGNKAFENKAFDEAEVNYKKATEQKPDGFEGWFNLGDALYKQQRFDEALVAFEKSKETALTDEQKARALHNVGNIHTAQKNYQKAIEAYKQALRLNPNDDETRYNLAKALRELKQQQQQDQDKNQDQQKDKEKQEKQDKQEQDQQEKQKKKDDPENKQKDPMKENEQNDDAKKNEEQQQQDGEKQDHDEQPQEGDQEKKGDTGEDGNPQQQKMSKEEMEQLLEAIANAEKQTRAKLDKKKKVKVKAKPGVKDW